LHEFRDRLRVFGGMVMDRVILPDCCEDWVLDYGAYYKHGAHFECIECGTPWRKLEAGRYEETGSGRIWAERAREAEGQMFRYLESEGGAGVLTNRCCAKLILGYGDRIKAGKQFTCPICASQWKKGMVQHRSGMQVAGYTSSQQGVTIVIQKGSGRDFLVPVDEYRPPLYE
jgi:hypothetical protein